MNKTTTLNDLILFAYNETELLDTVLVEKAIANDVEVAETYKELLATMDFVDAQLSNMFEPGAKTIDAILKYSKALRYAGCEN